MLINGDWFVRITPIYMGSTFGNACVTLRIEDHPHIHGEHPMMIVVHKLKLRITPIYMGSTTRRPFLGVCGQDHPHIHGEHWPNKPPTVPQPGSPPYTWGARNVNKELKVRGRITPIYMGSTDYILSNWINVKDHPHIHGEHWLFKIHNVN